MIRKLSALLAGVLLCSLASSQSVPNGGVITTGQVWTVAQWNNAWQSKFDVTGGTLTAPTINNPAITGGTQSTPSISSPTISGTVTGSPTNVGNWTFTPASGIALAANQVSGSPAIQANESTATPGIFVVSPNGSDSGIEIAQLGAVSWKLYNPAGTSDLRLNQTSDRVTFGANGNVVINAPSASLNTLTVNQTTPNNGLQIDSTAGVQSSIGIQQSGQNAWAIYEPASSDDLRFFGASADVLTLHKSGGIVVAAPSSGAAVTINGSSATTGALVVNGANCTGPCQAMTINGGSNTNNVALALKSNSEGEGLIVFGNTVAGQSHGLSVLAGTNSSDANMAWADASGATAFGTVWGDGGFSIGPVGTVDCGPGCLNVASNIKIGGSATVLTTASTASNLTSLGTLTNLQVSNLATASAVAIGGATSGGAGTLAVSGQAAVGSLVVGGVTVSPLLVAHMATNQASTSTTQAPTALSITLPLGSYAIDVLLNFNGTTTGTQGIKFNTTTGTSVASVFLGSAVGSVAGTPINGNSVSNFTFTNTSVASSVDFLAIRYSVTITTAGTYVVSMAQNSSSGNAANLLTGSYIIATKI